MNDIQLPAVVPDVRADEALLNITFNRQNGFLPDPVPFDMSDDELKFAATEVVHAGIPGIAAAPEADFGDYVIDRFPATEDRPYNLLMMRPKTPFGSKKL